MGLEKSKQESEIWKDYTEQKKKYSSSLDLKRKFKSDHSDRTEVEAFQQQN